MCFFLSKFPRHHFYDSECRQRDTIFSIYMQLHECVLIGINYKYIEHFMKPGKVVLVLKQNWNSLEILKYSVRAKSQDPMNVRKGFLI